MKIGWKVQNLTTRIASVRYRALLPMLALESVDVQNRIFSSSIDLNLDGLDALVIVKSFTPDDLFLAQHASSRGIRVVIDLCDNIFIGNYGKSAGKTSPAQIFEAIAMQADAIVVTTEPLAAIVRQRVPHVQVSVIPDGIETSAMYKSMYKQLRDAELFAKTHEVRLLMRKLRNLMVRLREEGLSLAVRLFWRLVIRGKKALRGQLKLLMSRGVGLTKKLGTSGLATRLDARGAQEIVPVATDMLHTKTILWFGNHGAPHASFGILDLLEIRDALESVAKAFDVELVVISNHRSKYEEQIRPLQIPSRYFEWSSQLVDQWMEQADVVVIPNSLDAFSICKSANRSVMAVSRGVPVVATLTPALEPMAPHIHTGDTFEGLFRYLDDREAGRRDANAAYELAKDAFGQTTIARAWLALLVQLTSIQYHHASAEFIVALNLMQDLDLAVPVLKALLSAGVTPQAWCSASLIRKSPRVLTTLTQCEIPYKVLPDELTSGSFQFLPCNKALLTVAETNLGPHRFTRKLTELALERNLTVATLQHGFENVGLTYEDAVHSIDRVTIKARRIYIWGGLETLHPRLHDSVRTRCISVGCPKPATTAPADLGDLLTKDRPVIGIFENLHWHRYDDTYRQAFLEAVGHLAEKFPQVTFLVKPHHAGLWLTHRYEGQRPVSSNLVIADPQTSPWENHTASALLGIMTAVITTPSTVALDAARYSLPVAVFAGDLDLSNYQPLPLLQALADWQAFVNSALDLEQRGRLKDASTSFVARVLVDGDGAQRIAADLIAAT
jgi:glycosyltransferase involved in cell wall biosynthesis